MRTLVLLISILSTATSAFSSETWLSSGVTTVVSDSDVLLVRSSHILKAKVDIRMPIAVVRERCVAWETTSHYGQHSNCGTTLKMEERCHKTIGDDGRFQEVCSPVFENVLNSCSYSTSECSANAVTSGVDHHAVKIEFERMHTLHQGQVEKFRLTGKDNGKGGAIFSLEEAQTVGRYSIMSKTKHGQTEIKVKRIK